MIISSISHACPMNILYISYPVYHSHISDLSFPTQTNIDCDFRHVQCKFQVYIRKTMGKSFAYLKHTSGLPLAALNHINKIILNGYWQNRYRFLLEEQEKYRSLLKAELKNMHRLKNSVQKEIESKIWPFPLYFCCVSPKMTIIEKAHLFVFGISGTCGPDYNTNSGDYWVEIIIM